jgi:hypothetical protein
LSKLAQKKPRAPGLFRRLTAPARMRPQFIIIGAQRCGTTSLYNNMTEHPCVAAAFKKEVHFFDHQFERGILWYRAHFPATLYRWYAGRRLARPIITGEASPYYLFDPRAPLRIKNMLPDVRLIAILRNPVDRAYSQYQMNCRKGFEKLSFAAAIDAEPERLKEAETNGSAHDFSTLDRRHFSYMTRGIYVDQLKVWHEHFDAEQLLILRSEDFHVDSGHTLDAVQRFLGLPTHTIDDPQKSHVAEYEPMDAATRHRLIEAFRPHNQRLEEYLGRRLGWDS